MSTGRESGRLLMLRIEEARWSAGLDRLLRDVAPCGVLLDCPLPYSPDSTREFLRKTVSSLPQPVFIANREEGGAQSPFRNLLPIFPTPRATAVKGPAATGELGQLIGEALSLLGFNTNFAPSLDLVTEANENLVGDRAFSASPKIVAECGAAFVRGLAKQRILACGKHFPGLGSVPQAVAGCLPVSGKPMAALWREDLFPYRQLSASLPMILVSSASYKAYDFDRPRPACLSPLVVDGLLRVKLGYQGVVVAYDLESKAVRGDHSIGETVVQSFLAGCDMMIVNAGVASDAARELQAAMDSGKISAQRLQKSLGRIQVTGKRLKPPQAGVPRSSIATLARKVERFACELPREGKESTQKIP
ncbi:MAG: glycoside hydrolase family 3 N-terminal domain-containing protein [Deltaproteobacteria bacterium]